MTLITKIRKLRRMSAEELRLRSRRVLRRRKERAQWRSQKSKAPATPVDLLPLLQVTQQLVPGTRAAELAQLQQAHADVYATLCTRVAKHATQILSGSWRMLGHDFDLTGEIDWHKDPRSEYRWERDFYADLPQSNLPRPADIKYVWELGRHQYLVELARTALLHQQHGPGDRALEILHSWIADNPLYEGVHWTSALEVAMRSISWLWVLASLAENGRWQAEDFRRVIVSLAEHAEYLEHHLEFFSSPYNHLIGEATALYLLGIVLEHHPKAGQWRAHGRSVLLEHGPRQFYPDGFCVEQATGYHYYTVGFLTIAISAARAVGDALTELEPVVHKAFRAGLAFRQPNGRWPAIGDLDSARALPVHHDDFWQFDSLSAVAAVLFDDPQLKVGAPTDCEEAYWLLGCSGIESLEKLQAPSTATRRVLLPDSGYAIACNGQDWLLFDAGPIADGLFTDSTPSTAHGHADTLQVLYFSEGESRLRDCGMPFYNGDPEWVKHFRSSAAHNTIEIEDAYPARPAASLAWTHVAPPPTLDVNFTDQAWLASACAEWDPGVIVERHVLCLPGEGLWIADWIKTNRPREVRWYWQLAADAKTAGNGNHSTSGTIDSEKRVQSWCSSPLVQSPADEARPESPVGWNAEGYGEWTAGRRLLEVATVNDRLLCVHYFGARRYPAWIMIGADRIFCGDEKDLEHASRWPVSETMLQNSDVAWHIQTERGPIQILWPQWRSFPRTKL